MHLSERVASAMVVIVRIAVVMKNGHGCDCANGRGHENGRVRGHEHGPLLAVQATLSNPKGRQKPDERKAKHATIHVREWRESKHAKHHTFCE